MPTKKFFDLNEQKRAKILESCIIEFSQYGYANGSTNRIIQKAGISKGSLFKYFQSKEELYFYVLDLVITELMVALKADMTDLPLDLFERTIKYSELEFIWYIEHPDKCKLITDAFSTSADTFRQKILERYNLPGQAIYYKALENIDISLLKHDKQKSINILKWFLLGFKENFISQVNKEDFSQIELLRSKYVQELTNYMEILKYGLVGTNRKE